MGEGTFGQNECLDNERKDIVAIKVVRSIQKYRKAAMIEIAVLQNICGTWGILSIYPVNGCVEVLISPFYCIQSQFAQMRPMTMASTVNPRMPMYPPGGPGLGQQIFYEQPPPATIPPQHGFGYQQQLVPGMRPGGPLMPTMFVPLVQQGHQGPRLGGRRANAVPMQQGPQPVMQQQEKR